MNEVFNLEAWRQVSVSSLSELGRTLASFLPNLVGAIAILGIGWIIAKLVEVVSHRTLDRLGLNRSSQKLGIARTLQSAGIVRSASQVIGRLLYWLLMLTFVLTAFETLGLTAVTKTIDRLIAYLPNVIGAAFILLVGLLVARFVGQLVSSGAAAANLSFPRQLGSAASGVVIMMVAILAVEQLGIGTQVLVSAITAVIAALTAGFALAFALGSRDVVRGILAGHYLRQLLAEGQRLEIEGRSGTLQRVGPTNTLFQDGDQSWSIPNTRLLDAIVVRPT